MLSLQREVVAGVGVGKKGRGLFGLGSLAFVDEALHGEASGPNGVFGFSQRKPRLHPVLFCCGVPAAGAQVHVPLEEVP